MVKRESVLENETPKILWDFEITMDLLILAKRQDPVSMTEELVNSLLATPF